MSEWTTKKIDEEIAELTAPYEEARHLTIHPQDYLSVLRALRDSRAEAERLRGALKAARTALRMLGYPEDSLAGINAALGEVT